VKSFKLLPALLTLFVLASCQSFNSVIQEPKLSLASVDIAGVSLSGVDLIARINVENPNGFSIPMPKVDWELFINKAAFTQGLVKNDKTVPKNGTAIMDVPFSVSYEKLFGTFMSLLNMQNRREAAYDLAMKINFPIPVIENKVYKLDHSGAIPLP
jgi:LEA14-like dessication related protein